MLATNAQRLQAHERSLRKLAEQLLHPGFISSGSVVRHADPPQLHGPYWLWSYRPPGGKTVSRKLSERQALLFQEWIANRRRLLAIVAEMEVVSRQAVEILLADAAGKPAPSSAGPAGLGRPTTRVTRPLAEALTQLVELVEPAAEAAQEWLESTENEDREAIAEARDQLLATLDPSAELVTTITWLARLLGSTPSRS